MSWDPHVSENPETPTDTSSETDETESSTCIGGCNINNCNVLYLNARSLKSTNRSRNKFVQLQNIVATDNIHMVACTETWFNSSILDGEILPSTFIIYRKDREETLAGMRGGGVMLAVSNHIPSDRRRDLESEDEILVCEINPPNVSKLMIVVCYRPQFKDVTEFVTNFVATVKRVRSCTENIVILGDFNLRHVDWVNCIYTGQGAERELCDFLHELNSQGASAIPWAIREGA